MGYIKVLALDISTKTGWAVFEATVGSFDNKGLLKYGLTRNEKKVSEYGTYPWSYKNAADSLCEKIIVLIFKERPEVIVVEETNASKARYTQKVLEFLHCTLMEKLRSSFDGKYDPKLLYVNSSEWRKVLGLTLSKEDKKNNQKLNKAKNVAEDKGTKLDKATLGIKGKVTKKHISVRWVNDTYKLELKIKDNDIADAICLGSAYIKGCQICDGVF